MPKKTVTFTLRDPTLPAPKVKKKTQLLKTKPKPNVTPWRHFQPSIKKSKLPQKSPRTVFIKPAPPAAEEDDKEDGESPPVIPNSPLVSDDDETRCTKEDKPSDISKEREAMENRLRRMKKQSSVLKKVYHNHVMDVPEMLY